MHALDTAPQSAHANAAGFSGRRRQAAMIIIALAFIMDLLDSTIVNIAIPAIREDLRAAYSSAQWLITGYTLSFAILMVTGGRLGDIVGYKFLFMVGVASFTLASLFCGIAWNPQSLIAARVLQGAAAAAMVPQIMSLVQILYAPKERLAVMGMFGILGGLAAALGPVVAGIILQANIAGLSWRPIFLVNVPVGMLGLIAGARWLPNGRARTPVHLDYPGVALATLGLFLLVFPLVQGRESGWRPWVWVMITASIPVFVASARYASWRMAHDGSALLVPALFKERAFSVGITINLVYSMAIAGFLLTFSILLQSGLQVSALNTGLVHLPFAIGAGIAIAVMGERLALLFGRLTISAGALLSLAGLLYLEQIVLHSTGSSPSVWALVPPLSIAGMGLGLVVGPLPAFTLYSVNVNVAGAASGIMSTATQLGNALGVALVGTVFFTTLRSTALATPNFIGAFAYAAYMIIALFFVTFLLSLSLPPQVHQ